MINFESYTIVFIDTMVVLGGPGHSAPSFSTSNSLEPVLTLPSLEALEPATGRRVRGT